MKKIYVDLSEFPQIEESKIDQFKKSYKKVSEKINVDLSKSKVTFTNNKNQLNAYSFFALIRLSNKDWII